MILKGLNKSTWSLKQNTYGGLDEETLLRAWCDRTAGRALVLHMAALSSIPGTPDGLPSPSPGVLLEQRGRSHPWVPLGVASRQNKRNLTELCLEKLLGKKVEPSPPLSLWLYLKKHIKDVTLRSSVGTKHFLMWLYESTRDLNDTKRMCCFLVLFKKEINHRMSVLSWCFNFFTRLVLRIRASLFPTLDLFLEYDGSIGFNLNT